MPTIKQLLAPDDISYSWNTPQWIVIHYTATSASAYNNAVYFSRGGNWNSSAHYFVDGGGTIYQSVPDWRGAWHAGNYDCNMHSIGIETVSDGRDFTASEISELAWLVQGLMHKYGIGADHVIRHYDVCDYFGGYTVDPHKSCPAPYVNSGKWKNLKAKITEGNMLTKEDANTIWAFDNWGDQQGAMPGTAWRNLMDTNRRIQAVEKKQAAMDAKLDKIVKKLGA